MFVDTKQGYGTLTRCLHWVMAIGFLWMLFTASVHWVNRDSALNEAIWPYHRLVGFTIFILGVIRVIWFVFQRSNRPENNAAARFGHVVLYVFMLLTPLIALLRQFGSGREFNYLGWQVMKASTGEIESLVAFGNQWHSLFGWALFALIIGHVVMSFYHKSKGPEHNVFPRIIGRNKCTHNP